MPNERSVNSGLPSMGREANAMPGYHDKQQSLLRGIAYVARDRNMAILFTVHFPAYALPDEFNVTQLQMLDVAIVIIGHSYHIVYYGKISSDYGSIWSSKPFLEPFCRMAERPTYTNPIRRQDHVEWAYIHLSSLTSPPPCWASPLPLAHVLACATFRIGALYANTLFFKCAGSGAVLYCAFEFATMIIQIEWINKWIIGRQANAFWLDGVSSSIVTALSIANIVLEIVISGSFIVKLFRGVGLRAAARSPSVLKFTGLIIYAIFGSVYTTISYTSLFLISPFTAVQISLPLSAVSMPTAQIATFMNFSYYEAPAIIRAHRTRLAHAPVPKRSSPGKTIMSDSTEMLAEGSRTAGGDTTVDQTLSERPTLYDHEPPVQAPAYLVIAEAILTVKQTGLDDSDKGAEPHAETHLGATLKDVSLTSATEDITAVKAEIAWRRTFATAAAAPIMASPAPDQFVVFALPAYPVLNV
ncbi:hypothetical protein BDK51DRAFT_40638 [Blyttiomyces helicus]|uniref:Uncharacterized protein n=1 Tax=Blyttiomyces helicus TaxID=388810 RepID=A0A4P9WED3_9FUNG|nr:hypothetical protein BDK51DRAFT_40638 [Blyttiomyces helicus]|eukprot:RKO88746.1 hypothetical protein BDK51DRAFT_40638 [Blyttiomyces helicus]